jgi:serine O-acetyltransferase
MAVVSETEPDWSREVPRHFWDPSRKLVKSIRDYQRAREKKGFTASLMRRVCVGRHWFWSVITGAEIHLNTEIAGGFMMPHPNGIVIHADAKIGPNCLVFQQVTIGIRGIPGAPIVGGHVDIGAGAKVLGAICLGNHCKIGANAVVLKDVPDNSVAVGVPAKILASQETDEASA